MTYDENKFTIDTKPLFSASREKCLVLDCGRMFSREIINLGGMIDLTTRHQALLLK
jgi:hypothetical protein